MEILAQPIDQSSWIKFRDPVLNQQSSLQNFRFKTLSTCSEQTCHKISLGPHFGVTRKDPDPKKIPRASFDLINLCAKFHSHILTESASNRRVTRPLKCQICPPLVLTKEFSKYFIISKPSRHPFLKKKTILENTIFHLI